MAKTLDEVRQEAMALSGEDRAALVDDLLDSALGDDLDRDQLNEWERRADELRSGAVKGIPAEDVIRELRAKYSGGHSSSGS